MRLFFESEIGIIGIIGIGAGKLIGNFFFFFFYSALITNLPIYDDTHIVRNDQAVTAAFLIERWGKNLYVYYPPNKTRRYHDYKVT